MQKNKKEIIKLAIFSLVLGIVGVVGSLIITKIYPFLRMWPLTTFLIVYIFALFNAFTALGVAVYVKQALNEFYNNSYETKNPVGFRLYKQITKEYNALNQKLQDFNNQPVISQEDNIIKVNKLKGVMAQQAVYNDELKKSEELSQDDKIKFDKFNKLNQNFAPIDLKEYLLTSKKPETVNKYNNVAIKEKEVSKDNQQESVVTINALTESLFEKDDVKEKSSNKTHTFDNQNTSNKDKSL